MVNRGCKKTLKVAGIVVASALTLLAVLAVTNLVLTSVERNEHRTPGKLVPVGRNRMHIYSEGTGKRNVILLSGWGTAGPVIDYKPLIEALKNDFTVTVVEYLGYGWSDWTNEPRTNANVVKETRLALTEAGISPPYILVPHSISGLCALYYANKYPDEIDAIIGLDTTIPAHRKYFQSRRPSSLPSLLRIFGILRLMFLFEPRVVGHQFPAYSDSDRRMMAIMYFWNYANPSQRDELAELSENAKELDGWKYPVTIPISMILSQTSIDDGSKSTPGLEWKKAHEDIIAGNKNGRVFVLNGGHFIHWTNSEEIAAIVRRTSPPESE
jgi:pimeloyl-ACP methyl ester carboxylesterase